MLRSPPLIAPTFCSARAPPDAELRKHVAELAVGVTGDVGRADGLHCVEGFVDAGELLVEIGDQDVGSEPHGSGVGGEFFQQRPEQGRLAGPVGADDAEPVAAVDAQRDLFEEGRAVEGFCQAGGLDDPVAGAGAVAEAHVRAVDVADGFDGFDPGELLFAVFGLFGKLPVAVAGDELFGPGDEFLLFFEGPLSDQLPFFAQPPVLGEIARIVAEPAVMLLQNPRADPVEEVAVVADQDHRPPAVHQIVFQPLGGGDVQVVCRFVEQQDIWRPQEQPGEEQPVLLSAAEGLCWLVVLGPVESEPREDLVDPVVDLKSVQPLQFVLDGVESFLQFCQFVGGGRRHLVGDLVRFRLQSEDRVQSLAGLVEERAAGGEFRVLLEELDPDVAGNRQFPCIGVVLAGQNPQESGLSRSVRPDQADPFARPDVEGGLVQNRRTVELAAEVSGGKKDHRVVWFQRKRADLPRTPFRQPRQVGQS